MPPSEHHDDDAGSNIPETHVLAIASHVAYGYVGNTMATFVLQSLGCEASAINTVNYSNHTGYKRVKGRKTPAAEILELYAGLKDARLHADFDVLLSGYIPSAEGVQAVGKIGRELRLEKTTTPGGFFWVLDPVMGDEGRLYIPEDEVPEYKALLREADLILPNQFEAEILSDTKITDLTTLTRAISTLHSTYQIPHILITSLRLSPEYPHKTLPSRPSTPANDDKTTSQATTTTMTIIGSTSTSTHAPRLFRIDLPALPVFFSGTGDMLAALMVPRLRAACAADGLLGVRAWKSPDDVTDVTQLPLARAARYVLASMQAVLRDTARHVESEMNAMRERQASLGGGAEGEQEDWHLRKTRAAEVRVVQGQEWLRNPPVDAVEKLIPKPVDVDVDLDVS